MQNLVQYYFLFAALVLIHRTACLDEESFNRNHTGVIFSPYVKNYSNGSIPNWRNYTFEDIKDMLSLVSTKFDHISTYGMGVGIANASWDEGDAVGLTAVAAANINVEGNETLSLSASLGIWHSGDSALLRQEALNAFTAAELANNISSNTVWGVALSSFTWMGYRTWKDAVAFLKEYRPNATRQGLKLGIRLDICNEIVVKPRPEDGLHSAQMPTDGKKQVSNIQTIARIADFMICTVFPSPNIVDDGTQAAVNALGKQMKISQEALKMENEQIDIIWETGWPSSGVSRFGSKNTNRNLRNFWKQMDDWANSTQSKLYMFAAFDEPWKTNPASEKEVTDPEGPNGAESHFGWWTLTDNDNIKSFVEKVPEPEETPGISPFVVAIIIIVLLIPIIGFLIWRLYKAQQAIETLSEQDIKEFQDGIPGKARGEGSSFDNALHLPYDRSYELDRDDFVIDELEVLGSGAFGIVFKGTIRGIAGPVAFKKPNKNISVSQLKNLLTEIKIMIYIGKHENVVVLLGAHTEGIRNGEVYIASECCALGSLESHLRGIPRTFMSVDNPCKIDMQNGEPEVRYVNNITKPPGSMYENSIKVPKPSLIRWSYEIANGMEYLAQKKVIHADLATRNVLLTAEGTAKITDFGLSRRLYEYTQYVKSNNQEPLPWRWMAIESLRNLSFSTMSDVWSYGITLWEIFTLGDIPYPGLSWNVTFVDLLENGLRMHQPKYATETMYEEMIQCWHLNPESRPTFTDLKNFFSALAHEEGKLGQA